MVFLKLVKVLWDHWVWYDVKKSYDIQSYFILEESTTLRRPGRGLNLEGMDSQVLRPISTTFCFVGESSLLVIRVKCFISSLKNKILREVLKKTVKLYHSTGLGLNNSKPGTKHTERDWRMYEELNSSSSLTNPALQCWPCSAMDLICSILLQIWVRATALHRTYLFLLCKLVDEVPVKTHGSKEYIPNFTIIGIWWCRENLLTVQGLHNDSWLTIMMLLLYKYAEFKTFSTPSSICCQISCSNSLRFVHKFMHIQPW